MHRSIAARVAGPLLAATLALAASVSLGADAMPVPTQVPPAAELAQVEGVTTATEATAEPTPAWAATATPSPTAGPVATPSATPTPASAANGAGSATAKTPPVWWSRYRGTNHVWMPTLGLSKPIYFYACGRSSYPANVVYRWGCGGHNNVYLFGHNYGIFFPLFDAWRDGRLRKGMPVIYADSHGKTRLYRVTTWRVLRDDRASWAYASQPVPSMTLQTCVARTGHYRLIVRLVQVAS